MNPLLKVEVRCCCVPKNLLGWLPCLPTDYHEGNRVTFLRKSSIESEVTLELARYREFDTLDDVTRAPIYKVDTVAFKSNHKTIEFFRELIGFEENVK